MDIHKARHVISILMESSLYLSLPLEERYSLLERLTEIYPRLIEPGGDNDEAKEVGTSRMG
jgi:hypothetical protein